MRVLQSFLRIFFRHFYTSLAWSYDFVASFVSVGQWDDWVLSILDPAPAQPILEIAHGPGHLLHELARQQTKSFGVDASRQMCRMVSGRLIRNGYASTVVQAKAQALPFQQESFATLQAEGQYRIVSMAEIRGPGYFDRVAGWLFRATGQYAELPETWSEPIAEAGFGVRMEDVNLSRSRVIRLIATRSSRMEGQVA